MLSAVALVLTGCAPEAESDSQEQVTTLRVGVINGLGLLPLQVASTHEFFEDHGIEVEVIQGTDLQSFAPALGTQYDLILSTPVDFLTAASRGIDLVAVATIQRATKENPNTPILTKDDSIQGPEDLAGKTVGVASLAGTSYLCLLYLLQESGVAASDVTLKAVPFPTAGDQLNAGQVDASSVAQPFSLSLYSQGYRAAFDPVVEAAGDNTVVAFYSSSSTFVEANPDSIDAFRAALDDAIEWILANDADARTELQEWFDLPDGVAESAKMPLFDTVITADDLEPFAKIVTEVGGISNIPDVETLVAK